LSEQILLDTVREALENSAAMPNTNLPGGGSPGV
jgi:hypothetical protein